MPNTSMPHTTDNRTEVPVSETERYIWKERIKMYVKYYRQLQYHLKKMYYIILGQVSDELCTTVKSIIGLSAVADTFDDIGLLKLI